MLQATFHTLITPYTSDKNLQTLLWQEVNKAYSGKKRYYHNLAHLSNLLAQLQPVQMALQNWETVLFALFYHDVVYNTLRQDNEAKSAVLAQQRMEQLGVAPETITLTVAHILATKAHQPGQHTDTDYFTDADLCILGQPWEQYEAYYKNIRKEYALYPAVIYNPGRKKVLQHFLDMEQIFKTTHFYARFERQARKNLEQELTTLD